MKQDKSDVGMPELEAGMVFKIEAEPDNWYLVLDHDERLYAQIRLVYKGKDGIIEIVKVLEARGDSYFGEDQITRIVYETIGDTPAVDAPALRKLLGQDIIGDQQEDWIRPTLKKKMTVAEVEKALGYGIEIVSD